MRLFPLIASALALSLLASGCNVFQKSGTTVENSATAVKATPVGPAETKQQAAVSQASPLLGCWAVTTINGENVTVNGENHPKFTFEAIPGEENTVMVIAYNGCNYLNGAWAVDGTKISQRGEFITSLKACQDAPYEFAINEALKQVTYYNVIDSNTIALNSASGRRLLTLRKRNLEFLNGAWQVTAIHGTEVPAGTSIKVVIDVDECKIHGNAGCNILNGTVVVNLDKGNGIEFKDLATTRMTCPAIATEQAFLLALEEVDTCTEGPSSDRALMKDSDGKTILTLVRIAPDQISEE